jgi:hypothetical protein
MGSLTSTNKSSKDSVVVADDHSFNMSSRINGYNTIISPYKNNRDDPKSNDPIDEEIAFFSEHHVDDLNSTCPSDVDIAFSSVRPGLAPPRTIFPAPGAVAALMSYTEELRKLPKQHVFAPPGKIGVAIDVLNGQPVVHKVRKGSPLEKLLQPKDVIVAIDDEDVSCMSAADVTSNMVRRMDRVRKITFVRRPVEL